MSGFPILDLILGMVFVYFMLSLITSSVVEMALTRYKLRQRILRQWLLTIFDKRILQPDSKILKLGQAIMDHCTTTALSGAGQSTAFIDGSNFSAALLEKITFDFNAEDPLDVATNLQGFIDRIKQAKAIDGTSVLSTELTRTLLAFAHEADGEFTAVSTHPDNQKSAVQLFRKKIEYWFDANMDRLEGELKKRYSRPLTFLFATLVCLGLNADSIDIARYLYNNPDARAKAAAQAEIAVADSGFIKRVAHLEELERNAGKSKDTTEIRSTVEDLKTRELQLKKDIARLNDVLPLGWQRAEILEIQKYPGTAIPKKIAGLLATILALMLGSPFWFDLLNKIVNIRGVGAKPVSGTDKARNADTKAK